MNIMQTLDIFGVPFQFNISGSQKINKTNVGGIIFVIIFILSTIYFGYQNYLFFSDNISSKSTISINPLKELEQFEIKDELIGFDIVLEHDVKLNEKEKKEGKRYVDFIVSTVFVSKEGSKPVDLQITQCLDTNLKGYMCIDIQKAKVPITLDYNPSFSQAWQKSLKIQVIKCIPDPNKLPCAGDTEIENVLLKVRNQFQIVTRFLQYNFKTEQFETTYKLDVYGLDRFLSFYSNLNLSKANYNIKKGFLWLNENKMSGITSTQKTIQSLSQSFLSEDDKSKVIYGVVVFYLYDKTEDIEIMYPLYTETFAQFMSVFGLLMVFGNIGKGFSETRMFDSFINIFLQEQYKRTLYQQIQKQKSLSQDQNALVVNQDKNLTTQLQKNLSELQGTNSVNLFRKQIGKKRPLKQVISDGFKNKSLQNFNLNETRLKELKEQTDDQICVYDMYRNITQIKLMLKLLLTEEQYSAIKFCGMNLDTIISKKQQIEQKEQQQLQQLRPKQNKQTLNANAQADDDEEQQKKMIQKQQVKPYDENDSNIPLGGIENGRQSNATQAQDEEYNCINHLEKLEIIDFDQEELNENLNKFLINITHKQQEQLEIDPLSQRIYNCLFIPHKQFES